ncbi:pilus assembly protein PilP [Pseudomarimonas salicorniae]|uniref:pilus assembly protein PilP n=1 Tax=Pseudomarimonas salicorniae TaxID=2933270 RepID=UPI0031B9C467
MNRVAIPARLVCIGLLLCLAGCTPGKADLESYVAEVKARPGPPLEPLPVMQQFETFEYQAQELRDPFSSPKQADEVASKGPRPDPDRRKEFLETFPLDGLDMVGSLGTGEELVALVVDPENVVHRVSIGNYLGQNEGRVTAISETEINLTELVADGAGGWIERQATLALDE